MPPYRRLPGIAWRTRSQRRRDTEQEIEAHLQMRIDDLLLKGVPADEAREQAIARFGELARARAEIEAAARQRDRRLDWIEWFGSVRRDLVVTGRRMRSNPGHALLNIAIFGFGIGLTTVMYSLVDGVLLRPLPFPESDRLVALHSVQEDGADFPYVSMGNWYDWRELNGTLESTGLHSVLTYDATISVGDGAFTVPAVSVAGAYFETLQPPTVVGVVPTEAVAQEGRDIAVVSEGFWRRVLGADPTLTGRPVVIDGRAREVVAVIRSGYEHPEGAEIWLPRTFRPQTGGARNNINFQAIARLAPGVAGDQAQADLSLIAAGIRAGDPEGVYSWGVAVQPLHETVVGDAGGYLIMLMGAVSLVLLVACANLAALGFARGRERTGEVAMRLSIGASRSRIVRQLLTEDLALAGIGGLVGLGLAWLAMEALSDQIATVVPRVGALSFDGGVLAAGLIVSLIAGTAAGLPPALGTARREGGRLVTTRLARRGRALPGAFLVGGEVALTVLLLTGSGLLLMSLRAVTSRDLGFDPAGVMTVDVALASPEYSDDDARVLAYWEAMAEELRGSPDSEIVGLSNWIPTGGGGSSFIELPEGSDPMAGAGYRLVSEDYFETLRIPLLRGRGVSRDDRAGGEQVVVINQAMADEFWPSLNPIGQRVRAPSMESYFFGGEAPWRTVVGVVGNIRHGGFESDTRSEMYVPYRQMPEMATAMTAVARVRSGEPGARMQAAGERVQALDRSLAVDVATLEGRVGGRLGERRLIAGLLAAFAFAALGLASLGVYGVLSFAVQRRTREVAIRSALGAPQRRLVRLVLGGAFRVVLAGTAVGILLAVAARGVMESQLADVSSLNPAAYLAAGACLLVVALAAAVIPARRAARLDPLDALRVS
jgi:putative ABC transport system permease protein